MPDIWGTKTFINFALEEGFWVRVAYNSRILHLWSRIRYILAMVSAQSSFLSILGVLGTVWLSLFYGFLIWLQFRHALCAVLYIIHIFDVIIAVNTHSRGEESGYMISRGWMIARCKQYCTIVWLRVE